VDYDALAQQHGASSSEAPIDNRSLTEKAGDVMGRAAERVKSNLTPDNIADSISALIQQAEDTIRHPSQKSNLVENLKNAYNSLKTTYSDPANVIGDVATGALTGGLGEAEGPAASVAREAAPAAARGVAPAVSEEALGRISRVANVLEHNVPGAEPIAKAVRLVKLPGKLLDAWNGPEPPAPPTPKPPAAAIPETDGVPWGSGGQGPLDLRGKRIETPASEAAPAPEATAAASETPATAASPATVPAGSAKLEELLNDALGGKPLKPGVTLKNQATAAAVADLPEGFTPVKSSALRGYKYDPATREFESVTSGGQRYVHGDVSPEEAQAFESAESKGKAWQQIRENPLVAKVVNGKRMPIVKPQPRTVVLDPETGRPEFSDVIAAKRNAAAPAAAAPQSKPAAAPGEEDLTSLLQQSVDQVKVGKGGVMTSAEPGALAKRWGVDPESLSSGREQTRGMTPEQTEAYIEKLADSYRKGRPVEPVMETRDAQNNIVDVDGRARAIAAQRAGIKRIPIMIRRIGAAAEKAERPE
jgi:hypothetical protein